MDIITENWACVGDDQLPAEAIETIRNDEQLKALYSEFNKLHTSSIPTVLEETDRKFTIGFSDDYYEASAKIHKQISFRMSQILNAYQFRIAFNEAVKNFQSNNYQS